MKRTFVLLFVGAAAALGMWYGLRGTALHKASPSAVTSLLPKETLAFVHLPDLKKSRAQWHETDLYKLWREPAVQDFLARPLTKVPKTAEAKQQLQEFETLEMTDAFLAITAFENHDPKIVGGFHFKGSAADAEKVVGPWRARLEKNLSGAKRETVAYEGHQIEVISRDAMKLATVYDDAWFFCGNDLAPVKALLDRADKRVNDSAGTLAAEENFEAAMKHAPRDYTAFGYARLDTYMQTLAARVAPGNLKDEQLSRLRQIRSVSAATTFTKNKVRDVLFIAMPKLDESGDLTRSSLALATKDSFLYAANLLNISKSWPDAPATAANGMPAALQGFVAAFAEKGITRDDWEAAFAPEIGVIGDWPVNSRLPALFAAVAVKDTAKANKIAEAIAAAAPEGQNWTASEKDGVRYFSQPPPNPMVPISPTIGISDRLLVAGLDTAAVEAAMKRSGSSTSELAASDVFKAAEKAVSPAKQSFAYIDAALLYTRLDATLRPMLVMAAAFMPAIAETVDLGKLPAAEVITRHLSPLVLSQSYDGNGYMTESVGPVSVFQAALGAAVLSGAGTTFYQSQMHGNSATPPEDSPSPTPEPASPTPAETP